MKKLKIYDSKKVYMFPNGKVATPEVMAINYPAIQVFPHVVETNEAEEVCYAITPFATLKSRYGIDSSLTDEEAIAKLEEILNTPEEVVEDEPTAEERIASALEYQNLLNMEDATEEEVV